MVVPITRRVTNFNMLILMSQKLFLYQLEWYIFKPIGRTTRRQRELMNEPKERNYFWRGRGSIRCHPLLYEIWHESSPRWGEGSWWSFRVLKILNGFFETSFCGNMDHMAVSDRRHVFCITLNLRLQNYLKTADFSWTSKEILTKSGTIEGHNLNSKSQFKM